MLFRSGKRFRELNRSFIIFICRFNLFPKQGRHRYTFANLCREEPEIELGDEAEKIFLCAEGSRDDISDDMKAFLDYVSGEQASDSFTKSLERAVQEAKEHRWWRKEYMTLLEKIERERAEALAEGLTKGHKKGLAEGLEKGLAAGMEAGTYRTLFSLVKKGLISVRDAAEQAGVSEDEFRQKMNAE